MNSIECKDSTSDSLESYQDYELVDENERAYKNFIVLMGLLFLFATGTIVSLELYQENTIRQKQELEFPRQNRTFLNTIQPFTLFRYSFCELIEEKRICEMERNKAPRTRLKFSCKQDEDQQKK
jgi:hypothetical protein